MSDAEFGQFILSCMKVAKEAEDMCPFKCCECGRPLTMDEIFILEAQNIKISKEELVCFIGKNRKGEINCQDQLMQQKLDERKHPDQI